MSANSIVEKALNEEGWRTTEGGHKIHIADDGTVDKGNPHVLAKIGGGADSSLDDRLGKMLSDYEDPKTKRMKERLAKMREKTEALRRGNEERRASVEKMKRDNERMKADIMKANVERWKRGLKNERSVNMETKSKVVANALNAVRNGYVKLYAKSGGTATVYEGDKVEYDGKVYTAKALGSPRMDSATLVDDAGNKLVVKMKDYKLKALNEDTSIVSEKAVNAKFKAGDKAYVHWFSGEDELVDVISYEPKGDYYIVRGEDGQLAHPKSYLLYPVKNSRVVANALKARNDKWIDDFHVIETKGTPDKELVDALKKKASAWKVAKRNFSDAAAASAHDKAEAEAMAVAKRLGARWVQQGAVLRVVMPN